MNPLTDEWIIKAEADLQTARREYRVRKSPNYDAVCFHSQQAVEKYLKAVLQENEVPIPRVHSLMELLALIVKFDPSILNIQSSANILEGYATQFRYPGQFADKLEAKQALEEAEKVCGFLKTKLQATLL